MRARRWNARVAFATSNGYTPPGQSSPVANLPAFCLVKGDAHPTTDSLINFELWVPAAGWNGKFVVTGNGGYSPRAAARRHGLCHAPGLCGHVDFCARIAHP